jgi:leucyl/phenylalanyl-tRNA---protein transferase
MIPWLDDGTPFPPLSRALQDPNGLLAAGGDLSPRRLLAAYRKGIFPWYSEGQPILWWSPDPRMVLFPAEFRLSHSLRKRLRRGDFLVTVDTAFADVMQACAATPRLGQNGTWITDEVIAGYTNLHELGYAHSVETWVADGHDAERSDMVEPSLRRVAIKAVTAKATTRPELRLVGGLYGVAIGHMFYGESMFSHTTDASKAAFAHLVRHLRTAGFGLIDCQMKTAHLASLGAREIPRGEFAARLASLTAEAAAPWPRGELRVDW